MGMTHLKILKKKKKSKNHDKGAIYIWSHCWIDDVSDGD